MGSSGKKQHLSEYWTRLWSNLKVHITNATWIRVEQERLNIPQMHFKKLVRPRLQWPLGLQ